MNNQQLIESFIEKIRAEDGLSLNTALSYKRDLDLFIKFLNQDKIDILKVNIEILRKYLFDLDFKCLKASSISRKISCLRNFEAKYQILL